MAKENALIYRAQTGDEGAFADLMRVAFLSFCDDSGEYFASSSANEMQFDVLVHAHLAVFGTLPFGIDFEAKSARVYVKILVCVRVGYPHDDVLRDLGVYF